MEIFGGMFLMVDNGMVFKWQDKLGTFCRSAADCAIILDTIRGKDSNDWSSKDIHLSDPYSIDVTKLTVGYLSDADMGVSSTADYVRKSYHLLRKAYLKQHTT